MSERECQEEEEDQDECEQRYPGLDKRHGFFRVINKNQVSRDEYHWNQQERQQRRKETLQSEAKEERRKRRRERQRPDKVVYQPPRARAQRAAYNIEMEVRPGLLWQHRVTTLGQASYLSSIPAKRYQLCRSMELAIEELIKEFEEKMATS